LLCCVRTTGSAHPSAHGGRGQNLVDLAPHIADARRLQLVLLGGFTGAEVEGHDREYLLTTPGWLGYDLGLGRTAQAAGALVMAGATIWAAAILLLPTRTGDVTRR